MKRGRTGRGSRSRSRTKTVEAPREARRSRPLSPRELAALESAVLPLVGETRRAQVVESLKQYLELLLSWNVRGNLISSADEVRIVDRHALDSLAVIPVLDALQPVSLCDLGSGGGLPGIPIKIVRPALSVTLVESRRMKSLFLRRAISELGLSGARVWQRRIETLRELPAREGEPSGQEEGEAEEPATRPEFDAVIARAVAPLAELTQWCAPLVRSGGHLVAFKGSRIETEIELWRASPGPWDLAETHRELRTQTHLVVLRRN